MKNDTKRTQTTHTHTFNKIDDDVNDDWATNPADPVNNSRKKNKYI